MTPVESDARRWEVHRYAARNVEREVERISVGRPTRSSTAPRATLGPHGARIIGRRRSWPVDHRVEPRNVSRPGTAGRAGPVGVVGQATSSLWAPSTSFGFVILPRLVELWQGASCSRRCRSVLPPVRPAARPRPGTWNPQIPSFRQGSFFPVRRAGVGPLVAAGPDLLRGLQRVAVGAAIGVVEAHHDHWRRSRVASAILGPFDLGLALGAGASRLRPQRSSQPLWRSVGASRSPPRFRWSGELYGTSRAGHRVVRTAVRRVTLATVLDADTAAPARRQHAQSRALARGAGCARRPRPAGDVARSGLRGIKAASVILAGTPAGAPRRRARAVCDRRGL